MNKECRDAQYSMLSSIVRLRLILPLNIYFYFYIKTQS